MPKIKSLSRTNGVKGVPHLYSIIPSMFAHEIKKVIPKRGGKLKTYNVKANFKKKATKQQGKSGKRKNIVIF